MNVLNDFRETGDEIILLRRLEKEDAAALKNLFDCPLDDEKAFELIASSERAWNEGSEYILGIVLEEDGCLKGILELYDYDGDSVTAGYRVIPGERGSGYAKAAVYVLTHQLAKILGVNEIRASVHKSNIPSVQVLRHSGFEQVSEAEGILKFVYRVRQNTKNEYMTPEGMKTVWCAGGCFWGSEKAFRMLDGVTETCTGYANGHTDHPRYEDVCRGDTGFKEAVRITYDPSVTPLSVIIQAFFLCVDPEQSDGQGPDIGSQYLTGVYYADDGDYEIIRAVFNEEKKKHKEFYTELKKLENFYEAEEYHQKYLDRFPDGYCHISKIEFDKVKALNARGENTDD